MIEIEYTEGGCRPFFSCDYCGEEITKDDPGNYNWHHSSDTPARPVLFAHKRCQHAFDRRNEQAGGERYLTMELECLPVYLLHNLGYTYEEADEKAKILGSF